MAQKTAIVTYGLESEKGEEWLGKVLNAEPNPRFIIELQGFGRPGGTESLGGISKEQHAKNFIAEFYPWFWQYWNEWQELQLWAWCNFEEIGATGCMNSGKSYTFSFLAWLEWMAAPLQSACMITSTTRQAIKARIWTHIKKFRNGIIANGKQICHPCHLIDSQTLIQATRGDDAHCMTSIAVEGGKLEMALGNLQGRHVPRVVVVTDEGEQTPAAIFSARFNLRGGTIMFKFVSCANAVNPASEYGKFIEPKEGWPAARDSDEFWYTKTGICLHLDALKSPNVKAGRVIVPGLVTREDVEAVRNAKGEDSLEWWMYIRGFPNLAGARNTILNWALIIAGRAMDAVLWQGATIYIGALDPSFTSGGDDCILRFARVGIRADGKHTLGIEPPIHVKLIESKDNPIDYQIADRVKEECSKRNVEASHFAMDATAASGLASIIEQRWKTGIKRVNFGSAPTERKLPGDDKTGKERCRNRVAEMWISIAALVRGDQVRGLDSDTAQEFCIRQYKLEGERYILERKDEMKKRTGGKSPDRADATSLLGDVFRDIHGVDGSAVASNNADAWEKAAKKHNLRECYA